MKKLLLLTVLIILAASFAPPRTEKITAAVKSSGTTNTDATETAVPSVPSDDADIYRDALEVIASVDADTFLVREHGGKIGVFADGCDSPVYTVDVFVFTLPEDIQKLLFAGIECDFETLELLCDAVTS